MAFPLRSHVVRDADPGETQLRANKLINTRLPTAPEITAVTWV